MPLCDFPSSENLPLSVHKVQQRERKRTLCQVMQRRDKRKLVISVWTENYSGLFQTQVSNIYLLGKCAFDSMISFFHGLLLCRKHLKVLRNLICLWDTCLEPGKSGKLIRLSFTVSLFV